MNYRHGYHAGNYADVLKHLALVELLRLLTAKDKKLFVLDTHSGAGGYDLSAGLATVPGVTPLRIWPDSPDRVAVQSFTVAGHPAGSVAAYLSAEHGIGVRDGRFCAHPLLARLCAKADGPDGDDTAVRASIGLGTTTEHIDRLVAALHRLVRRGASWTYSPLGGRWAPTPDPRDLDPLGLGAPGSRGTGCASRS